MLRGRRGGLNLLPRIELPEVAREVKDHAHLTREKGGQPRRSQAISKNETTVPFEDHR